MKRAIIVQGLGFGDEGKGATVDFLAREFAADLVVRYCGGSQAAHNVVLPDGRRHVFAQFGSGTLAGAATYLGEQMIINPPAMHAEARHLRELTGDDPFAKLLVHPRSLVSTVYHQQLNRLRELVAPSEPPWFVRARHRRDAKLLAALRPRRRLCFGFSMPRGA